MAKRTTKTSRSRQSRRSAQVTETWRVTSERNVQWSGAPCGGFLSLTRQDPDHQGCRLHTTIPWDDSWEPGSIVDVEMKVTLVKAGPRSRKRCHNPWPAHR